MYSMTLQGQGQNLTSGQGHVVTQVGRIAYVSMRLDAAAVECVQRNQRDAKTFGPVGIRTRDAGEGQT